MNDRRNFFGRLFLTAAFVFAPGPCAAQERIQYVIHISVDGLRGDAVTALGRDGAPNFYRLRETGVYTDNARTDVDFTVTLPNHTSMITGRPVNGEHGHNYVENGRPRPLTTLHTNKGSYISSVFDVVHDAGGSTGLFASKPKFVIFKRSYDADSGSADRNEDNNGRAKIDMVFIDPAAAVVTEELCIAMRAHQLNYSFVHLRNPDSAGHDSAWDLNPGSDYLQSVQRIDAMLGRIFETIESSEHLEGRTAIVLTSDHGGRLGTSTHQPPDAADNYTIPFYAWGPGLAAGAELYALNAGVRADPGTEQLAFGEAVQPIRNGDGANLVLKLLGLRPVPGSTINPQQDLHVRPVP